MLGWFPWTERESGVCAFLKPFDKPWSVVGRDTHNALVQLSSKDKAEIQ